MKKEYKKNNLLTKLTILNKIVFTIGITLIITGLILVTISLKGETLDEKYTIIEVEEDIEKETTTLSKGEIDVTKQTDYIKKGTFKVTYKNHYNDEYPNPLKEGSYINIVDIIENGFTIDADNIIVNGKNYVLNKSTLRTDEGILVEYKKNTIYIAIPDTYQIKPNTIVIYLKLTGREEYKEYLTSKECYFNFTPNINNDFYEKKTSQSYIIEGYGYIKIKEK